MPKYTVDQIDLIDINKTLCPKTMYITCRHTWDYSLK